MASLELSVEEINKMKVAELKTELKSRGLTTTGTKSELVSRLTGALQTSDEDVIDPAGDDEVQEEEEDVVEEEEITLTEDDQDALLASESKVEPAKKDAENHVPQNVTEVKKLSETDRLKMRAEKFGVMNEDLKKKSRAERFGLPQQSSNISGKVSLNSSADVDALKKRAERFGTVVSPALSKLDSSDKLKQRAERFGTSGTTTNTSSLSKSDEQSKLLKRKERFGAVTSAGNDDAEAKKRKRAERFGLT